MENLSDLESIYITSDPNDGTAELRCHDHPDWWSDADGTDLPSAVRKASDHWTDEHQG